jgi:PadR family transcriptional regulator PadR
MNVEKTISQMRKGVLELCIISIIARKAAYASDIMDELKKAKLIVVEGTLYPMLTRLKNSGFLSYHWEESKSGPPRKYYKITPLGISMLDQLKISWDELISSVQEIVHNNHE